MGEELPIVCSLSVSTAATQRHILQPVHNTRVATSSFFKIGSRPPLFLLVLFLKVFVYVFNFGLLKVLDLYVWLSFRLEESFPDRELASSQKAICSM